MTTFSNRREERRNSTGEAGRRDSRRGGDTGRIVSVCSVFWYTLASVPHKNCLLYADFLYFVGVKFFFDWTAYISQTKCDPLDLKGFSFKKINVFHLNLLSVL